MTSLIWVISGPGRSAETNCVSPCSWATCTWKRALGSTWVCSQLQKGEVYTRNFKLCQLWSPGLGESLGPGLVKLRGIQQPSNSIPKPLSGRTGRAAPAQFQGRGTQLGLADFRIRISGCLRCSCTGAHRSWQCLEPSLDWAAHWIQCV